MIYYGILLNIYILDLDMYLLIHYILHFMIGAQTIELQNKCGLHWILIY